MSDDLSPEESARDRQYDLLWRELTIERDAAIAEARARFYVAMAEAESRWSEQVIARTTELLYPLRAKDPQTSQSHT